jgi:hypothetical protein
MDDVRSRHHTSPDHSSVQTLFAYRLLRTVHTHSNARTKSQADFPLSSEPLARSGHVGDDSSRDTATAD